MLSQNIGNIKYLFTLYTESSAIYDLMPQTCRFSLKRGDYYRYVWYIPTDLISSTILEILAFSRG